MKFEKLNQNRKTVYFRMNENLNHQIKISLTKREGSKNNFLKELKIFQ